METKRNRPYEVSAGEDSSIKAEKEKRSHTENHFIFFFYVSFLSSIFYCYCQGDWDPKENRFISFECLFCLKAIRELYFAQFLRWNFLRFEKRIEHRIIVLSLHFSNYFHQNILADRGKQLYDSSKLIFICVLYAVICVTVSVEQLWWIHICIDVSNRRMYALQRKSLFYEAKINSCVGGKKKSGLKRQRKLDEGEDIDKKK